MKTISCLILILLFLAGVVNAETRQIGFVQQNEPGALVIASAIDTKQITVIIVRDVRKGLDPVEFVITKEEFEKIWAAFTGEISSPYLIVPGSGTNMSDVGYYTIQVKSKKNDVTLRIPVDDYPSALTEAIEAFTKRIKN